MWEPELSFEERAGRALLGEKAHRTPWGPADSVRRSAWPETGEATGRTTSHVAPCAPAGERQDCDTWAGARAWRALYAALQGQKLIPWAFLVSLHTKGCRRLNLSLSLYQGLLTRTSKHKARDSSACLFPSEGTLLLAAITAFTHTGLPGTAHAGALQPLIPGTTHPLTLTTEEPRSQSPYLQGQFTIPACLQQFPLGDPHLTLNGAFPKIPQVQLI